MYTYTLLIIYIYIYNSPIAIIRHEHIKCVEICCQQMCSQWPDACPPPRFIQTSQSFSIDHIGTQGFKPWSALGLVSWDPANLGAPPAHLDLTQSHYSVQTRIISRELQFAALFFELFGVFSQCWYMHRLFFSDGCFQPDTSISAVQPFRIMQAHHLRDETTT